MEKLRLKSNFLVQRQTKETILEVDTKIDWNDRLICLSGGDTINKTVLMLQRLQASYGVSKAAMYITMDDSYFTDHSLSDFAFQFRQQGGEILFIDQIHKYPYWAQEIKNIYDFYRDLNIVFTVSSTVDIYSQKVDLSRRAIQYDLKDFSYRKSFEALL